MSGLLRSIVCKACGQSGHDCTDPVCEAGESLGEPLLSVRCIKGKDDILSNMWPCEIRVYGELFSCLENAYHFRKATISGDQDIAQKIIAAKDATAGKRLAKELIYKLPNNWDDIKVLVMRKVMWEKYQQVAKFREELRLYPSSKWILALTLEDVFWGTGLDQEDSIYIRPKYWPGKNMHGVMLEEIRQFAETGKVHENFQELARKEEELVEETSKPDGPILWKRSESYLHTAEIIPPEKNAGPKAQMIRPRVQPDLFSMKPNFRDQGWALNKWQHHSRMVIPLQRPPGPNTWINRPRMSHNPFSAPSGFRPPNSQGWRPNRPRVPCQRCFRTNHLTRDCEEVICDICGEQGHKLRDPCCEGVLDEPMTNVRCIKGKHDILSNFWPCKIQIYGRTFNCAENAYHHRKAIICGDQETADKILAAKDALIGKDISKDLHYQLPQCWDDLRVVVMRKVIWAKYQQNAKFREELGRYPTSEWILALTLDNRFCGNGLDKENTLHIKPEYWPGKNMHCVILDELRQYVETGKVHENFKYLNLKEEELLAEIVRPILRQMVAESGDFCGRPPMMMPVQRPTRGRGWPMRPLMPPTQAGQHPDFRHCSPDIQGWNPYMVHRSQRNGANPMLWSY